MTWTRFMDMHSGGSTKVVIRKQAIEYIYIEAPENEARVIFYNRFGHNPSRVTCTCCGEDYSVSEEQTLELATAFERGCKGRFHDYTPLADYIAKKDVLVIRAEEITPAERSGDVP